MTSSQYKKYRQFSFFVILIINPYFPLGIGCSQVLLQWVPESLTECPRLVFNSASHSFCFHHYIALQCSLACSNEYNTISCVVICCYVLFFIHIHCGMFQCWFVTEMNLLLKRIIVILIFGIR